MVSQSQERNTLEGEKRVIGRPGAIAVVAGSMLGIGIFLSPRIVAEQVPHFYGYLFVWLFGGIVALSGAVAYAELGSMFPRSGGDYVFLDAALGRSAAVAGGWLLFFGVFCGSVATMAVAICEYQLPVLISPFASLDVRAPLVEAGPLSLTTVHLAAALLIITLTALNALGTKLSSNLQVAVTVVPIAILLGVSIWIFWNAPHESAITASSQEYSHGVPQYLSAFLAVYFAYAGWNAVSYIAGEVRDYGRTLPFGLLGGTAIVTGLYLILAAAFAVALGMGGLTTAFEAGTAVASKLWGSQGEWLAVALIAIALVGSVNATIFAGSRIASAMGKDGVLSRRIGLWGPRSTPFAALWLQAIVALALIVTGTFEELLELTSVAMLLLGAMVVSSLFVLRFREKAMVRPYRAMGYPILPGFYVLVSGIVIIVSVYQAVMGDGGMLERYFPVLGLGLFATVFLAHRILTRPKQQGSSN